MRKIIILIILSSCCNMEKRSTKIEEIREAECNRRNLCWYKGWVVIGKRTRRWYPQAKLLIVKDREVNISSVIVRDEVSDYYNMGDTIQ